jgi:hypothetical protein
LIPTKEEFCLLIEECEREPYLFVVRMEFEGADEVSDGLINYMISGCENDIAIIKKKLLNNCVAYRWLCSQNPFKIAINKAFPVRDSSWILNKSSYVMGEIKKELKTLDISDIGNKWFVINLIEKVELEMKAELRWIALLCSSLVSYHYPKSIYLDRMKSKCIEANHKILASIDAIKDIESYSDFLIGFPVVSPNLISDMNDLANSLKEDRLEEYGVIKRADSFYSERLFVANFFNKTRGLGCRGSVTSIISDILFLEGFKNKIDERSVRRICSKLPKQISQINDYSLLDSMYEDCDDMIYQ